MVGEIADTETVSDEVGAESVVGIALGVVAGEEGTVKADVDCEHERVGVADDG